MSPAQPLFNAVQFNKALFGGTATAPGAVVQVGTGLIYPALRKAGVTLGPGRTPSPAQFQDGIDELNRLIGSLNTDRLWIYALDMLELPIDGSQAAWTIGRDPAGQQIADFDIPAPQLVSFGNSVQQNQGGPLRTPLAIFTPQEWASIAFPELVGVIPEGIYYNKAYPIATIFVYGIPSQTITLELWAWHRIEKFRSIDDAVILPDGYEDALVLNLACRLAPQFQKVVHPDVREQAATALMRVLSLNAPQPIAPLRGLGGCDNYNIISDQFQGGGRGNY